MCALNFVILHYLCITDSSYCRTRYPEITILFHFDEDTTISRSLTVKWVYDVYICGVLFSCMDMHAEVHELNKQILLNYLQPCRWYMIIWPVPVHWLPKHSFLSLTVALWNDAIQAIFCWLVDFAIIGEVQFSTIPSTILNLVWIQDCYFHSNARALI